MSDQDEQAATGGDYQSHLDRRDPTQPYSGQVYDEWLRANLLAKIASGFYPLAPDDAARFAAAVASCPAGGQLALNIAIMRAANMDMTRGLA